MSNQPPKGLSKTDWRKVKKVATGPLLGPVPGQPQARKAQAKPAKSAPLGPLSVVREKLDAILEPEKRA